MFSPTPHTDQKASRDISKEVILHLRENGMLLSGKYYSNLVGISKILFKICVVFRFLFMLTIYDVADFIEHVWKENFCGCQFKDSSKI